VRERENKEKKNSLTEIKNLIRFKTSLNKNNKKFQVD